jgi:hypothetical protein
VSAPAAEQTYYPSWIEALRANAVALSAALAGTCLRFVREQDWLELTLVLLFVVVPLLAWTLWRLRVRVSVDGLRGAGDRWMKWSDVSEVESSTAGDFVVRSTFVPSVQVSKSIACRADFRQHLLSLIPSEHLIARQMAASAG